MAIPDDRNIEDKCRGQTFASWNVQGLNNPIKRGKDFVHLKSLSPDIIFLQETHLKNDSHTGLICKCIPLNISLYSNNDKEGQPLYS